MHLVIVRLAAQRGSTCRRRGLAERLSTLYDHQSVVLFIGVLLMLYTSSRSARLVGGWKMRRLPAAAQS